MNRKTSRKHIQHRAGFTLLEVVLVMILLVIVSSISVPYFAGTFQSTKLRTAARTIERMSRYGRSMAILREETLTMVLDGETMELFIGGPDNTSTNAADGELDQTALKNLGFVEDDALNAGIEKEIHRYLSDDLTVREFKKEYDEEEDHYENLYLVRFYQNGQCDEFRLELEDHRDRGILIENDPVSGKIWSEFLQ